MRMMTFAGRTAKEILRDPLNLSFGLGFPIVLLLMMTAIQSNIPVPLFEIDRLAPGIAVFGLSFMTLFSAILLSKDRGSAFLQRLYATPMGALDFILGYTLPLLLIGMLQSLITFLVSLCLGLSFSWNLLFCWLSTLPTALFFILLGLLCGSVMNEKQVGGICGALVTNLTGFLSGVWFDFALVGGVFEKIARCLPFYHAAELARLTLSGGREGLPVHLLWVHSYLLLTGVLAIVLFLRQMKKA